MRDEFGEERKGLDLIYFGCEAKGLVSLVASGY